MRIALSQRAAGTDRTANLEAACESMRAARRAGADLVAFPELACERFFPQFPASERGEAAARIAEAIPGPMADRIGAMARELSIVTVFNMYERAGDGHCYDSSPVFDADGSLLGITRMVHVAEFPGFHEQGYYRPGDHGAPVYATRAGRIGVAICYDRHYPEYMRALGAAGAECVVIPQAGALDEWPDGLFEAEVRTAAFQNGYYIGLCNRVGEEERLTFAGESFAVDPEGQVVARGKRLEEDLIIAELDLSRCGASTARRLFWRDRRPALYREWLK